MTLLKTTISLCPECLCDIPSSIYEEYGMAVMHKTCPDHGSFSSVVERDVNFYKMIQTNESKYFYNGLIIDITERCNLRCKWCYKHLGNSDTPIERIIKLASTMPPGEQIIISGGEPTLRHDLPEIVNALKAMGYNIAVITNGHKIDWSLPCRWTLSHHPESQDIFDMRIKEAKDNGYQFGSIIYTDNNLVDYYIHVLEALEIGEKHCGVFRFHAAAPVGGNLHDCVDRIFVSDLFKLLSIKGHTLDCICPGKTIFLQLKIDTVPAMLISWQTKENVDIAENYCAPWYHGGGDKIDNLVNRIIRDN